MKQVLLVASGILATIPGLAALTGHLPTPPGQEALFAAVAEVLGVSAILILYVQRGRIIKLRAGTVTKIGVALALFFLVGFGLNVWLKNVTVVSEEGRSSVFLPLWPGDELNEMINKAGSSHQALINNGADALIDASHKTPFSLAVTTVVVLAAYQVVLLVPVLLCCGLALRAKDSARRRANL